MKQICSICHSQTSIWTRIKITDGFICGKCASKCSEHILDDIRKMTVNDIREHLVYRTENRNSQRLKEFHADTVLGKYEVIQIDTVHGLWLLKKNRPFYKRDNPDIFSLSQITDIRVQIKQECINTFEKLNGKNSRLSQWVGEKIIRKPLYGYWFYLLIEVRHEAFRLLKMRMNQYIIIDKTKESYRHMKEITENTADTLKQIVRKQENNTYD